jgi:hypothetical protein
MKKYGVIFEHKGEGPLIAESFPLTYEAARERMTHLLENHHIIRVAIFEMAFVVGNETLIPKGE